MAVAPIVITTATGFVVGVLACIPETAKERKRVTVSSRDNDRLFRVCL